jgi:hypothetical protein
VLIGVVVWDAGEPVMDATGVVVTGFARGIVPLHTLSFMDIDGVRVVP